MDYNQVINQLIDETYSKELTWDNENPQSYQTLIFNYNFAYKAYSTDYKEEFKLLFVEKKFPDQHTDYEGIAEVYYPEILIIQNGKVIGEINEDNANKDELIRLAGAIETNNSGMNSFLETFKNK